VASPDYAEGVFDPKRRAVFLVGGDKSGNWNGWYDAAIIQAQQSYAEHLKYEEESK
jgi:hypothetical protein